MVRELKSNLWDTAGGKGAEIDAKTRPSQANAEADEEPLHYGTEESPGVMIVSLGARYKGYCANISRTFLVNPTEVRTCARMPPTAP